VTFPNQRQLHKVEFSMAAYEKFRACTARAEQIEEAELLRQAAEGSSDAFAGLVRLHQATVRWCLFRCLRDPATADDLAQEVFLAAYKNIGKCRSADSLRAWLLGIARNLAIQHVRGESRRRMRETGPLATQLAEWRIEQLQRDPQEGLDHEQTLERLRHCVDQLAPESRRVVEEHYFERLSAETIAQRQGRGAGAVRMMLMRIRKVLGECIRKNLQQLR
jgi:RNA polymerase sigma-70 factor, ECF subfamily